MGTWPRHDGAPNDPHGPSDGYATSLAALALCESGYGKSTAPLRSAIAWLERNQRASGRWFTRSTYSDRFRNYLSNMATAYAIMALDSCGASKPG
jgi:squalene-hopene/tetraprenyl-beta-curcumene cyclase